MKQKKGQALVEFITVYAWAFLIISVFIVIVFILSGSQSGVLYTPAVCTIQPFLQCIDSAITTYPVTFYMLFTNNLQTPIYLPSSGFYVTTTGIGATNTITTQGTCYPSFVLVGGRVICIAYIPGTIVPSLGARTNTFFYINYQICASNRISSCPTTSNYVATGYGTQNIGPSNFVFGSITFNAMEENGITGNVIGTNSIMYLNGVPQAAGQSVLVLSTGNYLIDDTPPNGYYFSSWSIASGTSAVANTVSAYTTLTLKANAVVNGVATNLACYYCYNTNVASLVCPAACPNTKSTILYPTGATFACSAGYEGCSK